MARAYQRGIARAGRGEEKFYQRQAARVPTEAERDARIDALMAPITMSSGMSESATNMLNTLPGGAGSDAGKLITGMAGISNEALDVFKGATSLSRAGFKLTADQQAEAKKGAMLEAAMKSRTNRRSALADWLQTYGQFASMLPKEGGSFLGSSTTTTPDQTPPNQTAYSSTISDRDFMNIWSGPSSGGIPGGGGYSSPAARADAMRLRRGY